MPAKPAVAEPVLQCNYYFFELIIKKNPFILNGFFFYVKRWNYAFLAGAALLLMISASPKGLSFAISTNIGAATNIEE